MQNYELGVAAPSEDSAARRCSSRKAHFFDGEGLTPRNRSIVKNLGDKIDKEQLPWIIGADGNMMLKTVMEIGAVVAMRGRVLAGLSEVVTCAADTPPSNNEFSLFDGELQPFLSYVTILVGE